MIIDIHAHTSSHVLRGLHTEHADICNLRNYAFRYGIDRIYLMATYFPLKKSGLCNLELLNRVKNDKLFGCFGSINLEQDICSGTEELDSLAKDNLIEGIKLYPGYQNIELSDSSFSVIFELAERYNLPVACHMGELHHCCPREMTYKCGNEECELDKRGHLSHPIQLLKVAKRFPNVNFIANHLGNPYFKSLQLIMDQCPNVYTDISGQFISGSNEDSPKYRKSIIEEIKMFLWDGGIERVMFGTDFPIQSYKDTFELVKELNLKKHEIELLLSKNAKRILKEK